jgi:hypothetical protein
LNFAKRTIIVNGEKVEFDAKTHFPVGDVSDDMRDVSSLIAWWGSVWAAAEAERINADAFYRQWRAKAGEALMVSDPKLSDEKRKQKIEAMPEFLKFKAAMALAEENVTLSKVAVQALDKKSNLLQSLGANIRSERRSDGMSTPINPKSAQDGGVEVDDDNDEAPQVDEARVKGGEDKMKATFKGKKKPSFGEGDE